MEPVEARVAGQLRVLRSQLGAIVHEDRPVLARGVGQRETFGERDAQAARGRLAEARRLAQDEIPALAEGRQPHGARADGGWRVVEEHPGDLVERPCRRQPARERGEGALWRSVRSSSSAILSSVCSHTSATTRSAARWAGLKRWAVVHAAPTSAIGTPSRHSGSTATASKPTWAST